jgi:hypothetical protein
MRGSGMGAVPGLRNLKHFHTAFNEAFGIVVMYL